MVSLVRRAALAVILSSSIAFPAVSDTGSGSYLAGRQAIYESDYPAAERYYAQALRADPQNPKLLENVVVARLALGEIERALTVAEVIEENQNNIGFLRCHDRL